MNLIKAIVYSLVISMSLAGVAEAKGRNGGSAFRGGFSSQRQKAPRPAPTYQAPANQQTNKTSFGGFGSKKANQQAGSYQQSQMGKDLSNNAAQANAMKTADARNNANNSNNYTNTNSGNTNGNGWFRRGNNSGQPNYSPPPVIHQTVVHRDSGGFMHGLMWFMLGHSMAQHNAPVYVPVNTQVANTQAVNPQAVNSQPVNPQANDQWDAQSTASNGATVAADTSFANQEPEAEKESLFMKLVRLILWAGVIAGVVWVVSKVMRLRNRISKANYSLGR